MPWLVVSPAALMIQGAFAFQEVSSIPGHGHGYPRALGVAPQARREGGFKVYFRLCIIQEPVYDESIKMLKNI
ncbi:hypothetical protein [Rhodoferax mekongensis]|uniref:Secreted protein n=1 Tax=Rhodoferax mekongensis TaxID=3068341 RepID=A0ABZ0AUY5_9BURK|nr:hypothetical protein [Rhodoferax sp. TBRC 17307]WNO03309.1 hypothetical protein RAN89_10220 [Rhodoferax sp. TBRC 17307]